ncbi:hypothetical protein [Edaphovirga cremea]|nr:hypothetical protein [Edaphovirga cremea]
MSDKPIASGVGQRFVLPFARWSGLFSPVVTAIVTGHVVSVERGINYV